MKKVKVSVLMVSYNHSKYIEACLHSVFKQKDECISIEMIIIDDGSDDGTCEIIENIILKFKYNIKFKRDVHKGVEFLNKRMAECISIATGDYIAFIASDDGFLKDRLSCHLSIMSKNKNIFVCYSPGINIRSDQRKTKAIGKKTEKILLSNNIKKVLYYLKNNIPELYLQGMTAQTNFIKENLKIDTKVLADDWQYNILIFEALDKLHGEYTYIDFPAFYRNIHETNTSKNFPIHYKRISEMADIYSEYPLYLRVRYLLVSIIVAIKNIRIGELLQIIKILIKNK